MSNKLFGWDLLYSSVSSDIKNNQDILVCLVHLTLVSSEFKCIGLGESKNFDGSEPKSEALPRGWNTDYTLRYVHQGRLYNLKVTSLDDAVMINLVRVDERNVSFVQLNLRSVVQRSGTLDEMIPDNCAIVDVIKKQLIDKVVISKKSRECSSQTEPRTETGPTTSGGIPDPVYNGPCPFPGVGNPLIDPNAIGVGRSDLDPFGSNPLRIPGRGSIYAPPMGGGGMLFQPPTGPMYPSGPNIGMPPGSVPPGARFDPFRPPDVDRFVPRRPGNPDHDEFPPPGYDDMFM